MTPQERPDPGRTRREGNVIHLRSSFETRLRQLVAWEARQQARQEVMLRVKREGKAKVSLMSRAEITRLAMEHLRANRDAMLAQAEASGVVQRLLREEGKPAHKGTSAL